MGRGHSSAKTEDEVSNAAPPHVPLHSAVSCPTVDKNKISGPEAKNNTEEKKDSDVEAKLSPNVVSDACQGGQLGTQSSEVQLQDDSDTTNIHQPSTQVPTVVEDIPSATTKSDPSDTTFRTPSQEKKEKELLSRPPILPEDADNSEYDGVETRPILVPMPRAVEFCGERAKDATKYRNTDYVLMELYKKTPLPNDCK